jgi:hypothetical protein
LISGSSQVVTSAAVAEELPRIKSDATRRVAAVFTL